MAPPDMPQRSSGGSPGETVDLDGVVLDDARTGEPFDFGTDHGLLVLAVIRHRY